jgi:hypothetical protein
MVYRIPLEMSACSTSRLARCKAKSSAIGENENVHEMFHSGGFGRRDQLQLADAVDAVDGVSRLAR